MVRRLTDAAKASGRRGEGIRTIVYGGGPMYTADIEEAVDWFGPKFVQIYGQGECPMAITALSRAEVADRSHRNWRARLASVGRAQSAGGGRHRRREGRRSAPRRNRRDHGARRARHARLLEERGRHGQDAGDGWLMTGDVGRLDEDGYLTLADRSKDVIISGGTNIYPREVEEVLLTHRTYTRSRSSAGPRPNGARMSWPSSSRPPAARWMPSRARRPLPGGDGAVQAAQGLHRGAGIAQEQLRQGAQDRAAQDA
jgi:long-chain acyl-CoA synthetase